MKTGLIVNKFIRIGKIFHISCNEFALHLKNLFIVIFCSISDQLQMVRKSASGGVNSIGKGGGSMPSNEECGIRDVWGHNLEEEFRTIRQVVQQYQYIAMDTEFPGVVARPIGEFRTSADYQYQLLRCNVDLLRIIQLGLTFLDESGNTPGGSYTTWQFNFKFNLQEDMYAQDSIDMLQNSGIQFKKHEEEGIDPLDFAELLMTSGIVLADDIKWLSFHSGYDFGYLLKLLTDQNLPQEESEFFELLRIYFPTIYDVKVDFKKSPSSWNYNELGLSIRPAPIHC
ncbi:CCR4-NOT transcription complex subunit 8 isoform X4 [Fopius arisanus]|uniref:poly(A)-specific ribonuclease n=1 Tax=Fopius arisanus TaxID=64838 RepID=A0A9R1TXJ7_9HYME|nr:PREDICTED: CCR4-NOT transcription complex subunit 8 isoform X4 [Fopius arisanus]